MLPIENVQEILRPYARSTWIPVTKMRPTSLTESKYGGNPWMAPGEEWPTCSICRKEPLVFVMQLDLASLPDPMRKLAGEKGLIQLFYSNDDCFPDDDKSFAVTGVTPLAQVRLIQPHQASPVVTPPNKTMGRVSERAITGWKERTEYPNWEHRELLGIPLKRGTPEYDVLSLLSDMESTVKNNIIEESQDGLQALRVVAHSLGISSLTAESFEKLHALSGPYRGDKLGGWECWTQGPEPMPCAICQKPGELIYQLNALEQREDPWTASYAPNIFASDGTGHLSQCPVHKTQLKFQWACG